MVTNLIKTLQQQGLEVDSAARGAEVKGWLHSGNYALNFIMSGRLQRGYPLGHVTEVFGENSTGKSYLIARALGEAQRANGTGILDDAEGALNLDWASRLGVDTEGLVYTRSRTIHDHMLLMEKILEIISKASESRTVCAAVDSLASLTTEHELATLDKNTRDMQRAQEIHKLFRVINAFLKKATAAYLLANHKIAPMNQFSRADSTGGGGPKYYSSVRLDLRMPKQVKDTHGNVVGSIVRAVAFKTRWTGAFKEALLHIPYYSAISEFSGLIPLLMDQGLLTIYGNNLVWDEEDTEIRANKTNFVAQDRSAAQLVEDYPDILRRCDEIFAEREASIGDDVTADDEPADD